MHSFLCDRLDQAACMLWPDGLADHHAGLHIFVEQSQEMFFRLMCSSSSLARILVKAAGPLDPIQPGLGVGLCILDFPSSKLISWPLLKRLLSLCHIKGLHTLTTPNQVLCFVAYSVSVLLIAGYHYKNFLTNDTREVVTIYEVSHTGVIATCRRHWNRKLSPLVWRWGLHMIPFISSQQCQLTGLCFAPVNFVHVKVSINGILSLQCDKSCRSSPIVCQAIVKWRLIACRSLPMKMEMLSTLFPITSSGLLSTLLWSFSLQLLLLLPALSYASAANACAWLRNKLMHFVPKRCRILYLRI